MLTFEKLKDFLMIGTLCIMSLSIIVIFFRAVLGPRVSDRIVSINMIGTKIIIMICLVAYLLREEYLIDVAVVYALINFVSMVVLTYAYKSAYLKEQDKK